jgi:spore maturation protein CgeB
MRFLILNSDYPESLEWLYAKHPGLAKAPYEEQMAARNQSLLGIADFYSSNLRKLGHEAYDINTNNIWMQKAWAREHGVKNSDHQWRFHLRRGIVPWIFRVSDQRWFYDILAAQIKLYKPDVLLTLDMGIDLEFVRKIRSEVGLLVGQHAATPLSDEKDWSIYDLMISSFPPTVAWSRERNIPAALVRWCADPSILGRFPNTEKTIPVSFVGSFFDVHRSRTSLLEQLATMLPLQVWGLMPENGFKDSPLKQCYRGTAWGIDMFSVLAQSRITLNHHGNTPPYANNMRIYEATVVGALLVTDWKQNLHEMFEPGTEVIAYHTAEECAELIHYYLEHEEERKTIAAAGQHRTLHEHTYYHRMQELLDVVQEHLA